MKRRTVVSASRGTGYFPDASPLEGGFKDRFGRPLRTLQDFLEGKSSYVSVAMDRDAYAGDVKDSIIRIPELEQKHNRIILFKVCDTGGAFDRPGVHRERIDICVRSERDSLCPVINGPLTLLWLPELNLGDPWPESAVGDMKE